MKHILKKIPDGKLVRIDIDFNDNKILEINITGDFFLFPEIAIDDIEDIFKNKTLPINRQDIIKEFDELKVELIGVSINDIIDAIEEILTKSE